MEEGLRIDTGGRDGDQYTSEGHRQETSFINRGFFTSNGYMEVDNMQVTLWLGG